MEGKQTVQARTECPSRDAITLSDLLNLQRKKINVSIVSLCDLPQEGPHRPKSYSSVVELQQAEREAQVDREYLIDRHEAGRQEEILKDEPSLHYGFKDRLEKVGD